MLRPTLACLVLVGLARAHGQHSFDLDDQNDEGMSYAERHMHTEHHIDSFDLPAFFKLHDLNMDGFWEEAEIMAVYGLHHHKVKEMVPDQGALEGRTKMVVDKVLEKLDTNKDGRVSEEEFLAGGREGLPSFVGYKDLGHHYDEESEYFLHHEELYHSDPETQSDESYTHPEDIEHFQHHAHIEDEEDARERHFQGLPADADLSQDHVIADPLDSHRHAVGEGPPGDTAEHAAEEAQYKPGDAVPGPPPKIQRVVPGASPNRIDKTASEALAAAGEGWKGAKGAEGEYVHDKHGRPRNAEERLRAGVPYKYKFRKGLRADEF